MPADRLNATFAALADPTRRAILARLAAGEASVTALAEPFDMSLPAISKHLKVLERAGLIARGRAAQWRPCRLQAGPAEGRRRLAGALSPLLGAEPRSPGRLPGGTTGEGDAAMTASRSSAAATAPTRTRRFAADRCAARAGVQGVDAAGACRAMVGTAGLHRRIVPAGCDARRHLPRRHALARGHHAHQARRLSARSSHRNAWSSPMPGKTRTATWATQCTSPSPSKRKASRPCSPCARPASRTSPNATATGAAGQAVSSASPTTCRYDVYDTVRSDSARNPPTAVQRTRSACTPTMPTANRGDFSHAQPGRISR